MKTVLNGQRLGVKLNWEEDLEDLDFADDIALLAEILQAMQEKTNRIDGISRSVGLKINEKKTNIMVINEQVYDQPVQITLNGKELEKVDDFTYLGSKIDKNGNIQK